MCFAYRCASHNGGLGVTVARCASRNDGLRGTMSRCTLHNDGLRVTMDSAYRWHGVFRVTMCFAVHFRAVPIGFAFSRAVRTTSHRSRRGRCVSDCYDQSHIGLLHPTDTSCVYLLAIRSDARQLLRKSFFGPCPVIRV